MRLNREEGSAYLAPSADRTSLLERVESALHKWIFDANALGTLRYIQAFIQTSRHILGAKLPLAREDVENEPPEQELLTSSMNQYARAINNLDLLGDQNMTIYPF